MSTCQERVISRPQEGGRLDLMAPSGLFQLCVISVNFISGVSAAGQGEGGGVL